MDMKNEILMRRRTKVIMPEPLSDKAITANRPYVCTFLKNLEACGYTVSEKVLEVLNRYSIDELYEFYKQLIDIIDNLIGNNYFYKPMYPNFPKEVMDMDATELYFNAFIHYLSAGQLLPNIQKEKRLPLFDPVTVKVIDLANEDELVEIMQNLISSKTSLSAADLNDVECCLKNGMADFVPDVIPVKENAAYVCALYLKNIKVIDKKFIRKHIKTATDVLRLATAMSGGDISLADNSKFTSFSRKVRKLFLSILNTTSNLEEDMLRYKNRWIRLGERLHPAEYGKMFPIANTAFGKIRNNEKITTFNGRLDKLIKEADYTNALLLLKTRAGEFARKLDYILRIVDNKVLVIEAFRRVAKQVSTVVLLQVKTHFEYRNNQDKYRVFFPKGNLAKAKLIENSLPVVSEVYCRQIVQICEETLIEKYSERDYIGKIYLSEEFKNYFVPFSQRSASNGMRNVVRGSKLPIDETTNTIRCFIHWHNLLNAKPLEISSVDIDLSAAIYDENWNYLSHISYTNLRSSALKACHSGDIVDAPNGACEFIDVDLISLLKYGGRYIAITVNSFSKQPFSRIPECYMGWMERTEPMSGEIFEPATVKNRIDLTAESLISIPMIIDAVDRKVIWADMSLKAMPNMSVNLESNNGGIVATCMAITNMRKPTMYDLIVLNARARGSITYNINEANIAFVPEVPEVESQEELPLTKYITPYMLDVFMGEFL